MSLGPLCEFFSTWSLENFSKPKFSFSKNSCTKLVKSCFRAKKLFSVEGSPFGENLGSNFFWKFVRPKVLKLPESCWKRVFLVFEQNVFWAKHHARTLLASRRDSFNYWGRIKIDFNSSILRLSNSLKTKKPDLPIDGATYQNYYRPISSSYPNLWRVCFMIFLHTSNRLAVKHKITYGR